MKSHEQVQCNTCKHQTGFTAGTIFHSKKLPLVTWCRAIFELTQARSAISSIHLARRRGVRQPTAWLLKQKLMSTMAERDAGKRQMSGRGEVDDVYPGRARSGGKRGRSAADKLPLVATVETSLDRRIKRFKLQIAKGLRKAEITKLAQLSVTASSHVVSGGLSCWQVVTNAGSDQFPKTTGSSKKALQSPSFNWVSTTLGNIKTALAGNYQHVSTKHAQDDLASVASHFSRRYQLDTLTERLTWAELYAKPWSNQVAIAR